MWTSIMAGIAGIPGLLAGLGRAIAGLGIYLLGRREQSAADRIRDLERRVEGDRQGRKVQEDLRRLAPDARRDRLRRWERRDR
jgi:hypothetical protein